MEGTTATPLTSVERTAIGPIDCMAQGARLVMDHLGAAVGVVLLFYLAMFIPYGSIVLLGPATCGLYYVVFKWMRGEPATVGSIFKGFEWMWDGFLATILMVVAIYAVVIPPLTVIGLAAFSLFRDALVGGAGPDPMILIPVAVGFYLLFLFLVLVVSILFMFVFPLITERGMSPFSAIKWSVRGVLPHVPGLFALHVLNGILGMIGFLLCVIPGVLYVPIAMASTAFAFRKVYGLAPRPAYRDFEERDANEAAGGAASLAAGGWRPLSASGPAREPASAVPQPPAVPAPVGPTPSPERAPTLAERPATERMVSMPPAPRFATVVEDAGSLPKPPYAAPAPAPPPAARPAPPPAEASPSSNLEAAGEPESGARDLPPDGQDSISPENGADEPDSDIFDDWPDDEAGQPAETLAPPAEPVAPEPPKAPRAEPAAPEPTPDVPAPGPWAPEAMGAASTRLMDGNPVLGQVGPAPSKAARQSEPPRRPMTPEELGAAETRLMDSNPLLGRDEEGS